MVSVMHCWLLIPLGLFVGGCSAVKLDVPGVADPSQSETVQLDSNDVKTIIAQAAAEASRRDLPVTIAVVDHTGVVLGAFQMGENTTVTPTGGGMGGLDGRVFLKSAYAAALSKAGTGAFFGTQGNAFTTRTAGFIVQEHFPPQVNPAPGGPLFGVQFSNLQCSDVDRGSGVHTALASNLPFGLSADPGGLPLYKNGVAVGGIGVEGDGSYTVDPGQPDTEPTLEEIIAAAGTRGFSAPPAIRGDNILVGGFQFVFANAEPPDSQAPPPYEMLKGMELSKPVAGGATPFVAPMIGELRDSQGTVPPQFATAFLAGTAPPQGGLTAEEVTGIIKRAATEADQTRAAIRLPLGTPARVTISVVDAGGKVLAIYRTLDAPIFGFDVSVQKARTAAFFSSATAASDLQQAGLQDYVAMASAQGVLLDGKVAFSTRAVGFLSQPIFPPGASAPFAQGPFSKALGAWSVFNTGLQLDLYGKPGTPGARLLDKGACTALRSLPNGITIFPGGFPLYRGTTLVGAIGVSGDGVDQDDLIAYAGSIGFEAPAAMRSDTLMVKGVTLPYGRFPRHPNISGRLPCCM